MSSIRANLALAVTLLTVVAPAAGRAAAADSAPRPKLVIPVAEKDFGVVATGTDLTYAFILRNEGNAPLEIKEVIPGRGTVVKSFDPVIAPGMSGTLVADLDALKLNGTGSTAIRVMSNDADQPMARLTLTFDVRPEVVAKPGYARWIYVQREPTGTIIELIHAKDGQPFDVLGVETPPGIHASFRPATVAERDSSIAGPQWRVELTLDPGAAVGAIAGNAVVKTNHAKQKRVPIPISGFVRPRYLLEPPSGDLGKQTLVAPQTFKMSLRNFGTQPIDIVGLETTIPGMTAAATPMVAGHYYSIGVTLDPATMANGPFDGRLIIRLSDPLQPTLEVPLSGELVRPAFSAG